MTTAAETDERPFGTLESQIPDAERFKECIPFSVRCRNCKASFAFSSLVAVVESETKVSLLTRTSIQLLTRKSRPRYVAPMVLSALVARQNSAFRACRCSWRTSSGRGSRSSTKGERSARIPSAGSKPEWSVFMVVAA